MRTIRIISGCILAIAGGISLSAGVLAPYHYATQFREHANEPPGRRFLLGTDELGRDRLSRLLHGTCVSLLFAPAAALCAVVIAAAIGIVAAYRGGWVDAIASAMIDLFMSLPWLFALLTLRALLPLDLSPWVSIAATFVLLAVLGWAPGARVVRGAVGGLCRSASLLHARACGCRPWRLILFQLLPNLRPIIAAQFWILVPVFLLTEANLGMLGLGIAEPMPSWGNLLAELRNYEVIAETPWILAPAVLLVLVVASLHFLVSGSKTWE